MYKFKGNTKPSNEAQRVGEVLDAIASKEDGLHPCHVVKEAKKKGSSLHKYFEWDDGEAAGQYRLVQARRLIVSIELVREEDDEGIKVIPAYTHLRSDVRGYRPTQEVYSVLSLRESLVSQLRVDWAALKRKHDEVLRDIEFFHDFNESVMAEDD